MSNSLPHNGYLQKLLTPVQLKAAEREQLIKSLRQAITVASVLAVSGLEVEGSATYLQGLEQELAKLQSSNQLEEEGIQLETFNRVTETLPDLQNILRLFQEVKAKLEMNEDYLSSIDSDYYEDFIGSVDEFINQAISQLITKISDGFVNLSETEQTTLGTFDFIEYKSSLERVRNYLEILAHIDYSKTFESDLDDGSQKSESRIFPGFLEWSRIIRSGKMGNNLDDFPFQEQKWRWHSY
jgi:hypothetical protein